MEWVQPADRGSPITGYHLTRSSSDGSGSATGAGLETSINFTSLAAGTEHWVSVQARNANGRGEVSHFTFFRTPVADPGDELAVIVTPTLTTTEGSGTVTVSAYTTGGADGSKTHQWTSDGGVGTFTDSAASTTTWTAPAATSTVQYAVLRLTVTDTDSNTVSGSMIVSVPAAPGTSVPPLTEPAARIGYVVEDMLAQPWRTDPSMTVGQAFPWLRETWDYATHAGAYEDLEYDFTVGVGGTTPHTINGCYFDDPDDPGPLVPCDSYGLYVPESRMTDEYVTGPHKWSLQGTLVHEMAHIFTMSSRVSADGAAASRPDLNAIAMMYFFIEHRCTAGPYFELIADAFELSVYPTAVTGYWRPCGLDDDHGESFDIVSSILAGEYPQWFVDRYGLDGGGFALRRFWSDTRTTYDFVDPLFPQFLQWQLRGAFGSGYCDWNAAKGSARGWNDVTNPWSFQDVDDSGCFGAEGWWDALTPQQRTLALFGDTPTAAQAASAGESYGAIHPDIKRFVNEAASELYGYGKFSSIAAWWNDLSCRLKRVAAGDGNDDDASIYCANYRSIGEPGETSTQRSRVDTLAAFLAGGFAPEITSGGPFTVDEATTAVATLTAVDGDTAAGDLQWSKTGGTDADEFNLSTDGALALVTAKDFENPDDANTDGSYEVTVQVSDGTSTDTADLVVTLDNVIEFEGVEVPEYVPDAPLVTTAPIDVPSAPLVTIAPGGAVTEGEVTTFKLIRTTGVNLTLTSALTVRVGVTAVGSTLSGSTPATVSFEPGSTTATLEVATLDDTVIDDSAAVTVLVLGSTADPPVYLTGAANAATVAVDDNDVAAFNVPPTPTKVAEGGSVRAVVETVNITFAEPQTLTLALGGTATPVEDFTVTAGSGEDLSSSQRLVLPAGARSANFTIRAGTDSEQDSDETIEISISHNASRIGAVTVTITETDALPVIGAGGAAGVEIKGAAYAAAGAEVVFDADVSDGAPISALSWTVSGPGGFTATSSAPRFAFAASAGGAYTVSVVVDDVAERTLTSSVTLTVLGDIADNQFADEIVWLAEAGITRDCADHSYCPNRPVTRAEMASLLARALDLQSPRQRAGFDDVDPESVHAADIEALFAAQITTGCNQQPLQYCPNRPVTRAQMAAFLYRARDLISAVDLGAVR